MATHVISPYLSNVTGGQPNPNNMKKYRTKENGNALI